MEAALIVAALGGLLLLAFRQGKTTQPADGGGQSQPPPTIDDLPSREDAAVAEYRALLEAEILRATGERVSLTSDTISALQNEYLLVLAKLGNFSARVPPVPGSEPSGGQPGTEPKFFIGQDVLPKSGGVGGHIDDRRWDSTLERWEYHLGAPVSGWYREGALRAAEEITPAPEPSGSEFDVGDRVRVSTSIGLKEGEVTAVRWDSQREVFRYTVPLDGNSWEYSPSQLTLVTTATVQDPGDGKPSLPRFRIGQRVRLPNWSIETLGNWRWDPNLGIYLYATEERTHYWWAESYLEAA